MHVYATYPVKFLHVYFMKEVFFQTGATLLKQRVEKSAKKKKIKIAFRKNRLNWYRAYVRSKGYPA